MLADLHSHSYYSDGVLSPADLLDLAHAQGVETFALTDHDTTDGLDEAQIQADKLGVRLIHGVEISAVWGKTTIHILGLNIDPTNAILQAGLVEHQTFRQIRAEKMARGLAGAGVVGAMEKTKLLAKKQMITRTHFAQMLIQAGVCKDMKSVFKRFLSGKKPGGVGGKWAQFDAVIGWIHAAGGLAILAHPLRYRLTNAKTQRLIADLANAGCDGLEVATATTSADEIARVNRWTNDFDLLASSGSDYHGWHNQRVQIGRLPALPNAAKSVLNFF